MYLLKRILTHTYKKKHYQQLHHSIELQRQAFRINLTKGAKTAFGRDHQLDQIKNYDDYRNKVTPKDYDVFKPYIDNALQGMTDQLWPGTPAYFLYTSATTSERKLIPITKDSLNAQILASIHLLYAFIENTRNYELLKRPMFVLGGTPEITQEGNGKLGRASGIVRHHIPKVFLNSTIPSFETQSIKDMPTMLDTAAQEILGQDIGLFAGFPTWLQMFMQHCQNVHKVKHIKSLLPNLNTALVYGVNYRPYEEQLNQLLGRSFTFREIYSASEGTFAYQDTQNPDEGLLLDTVNGLFFEFVPINQLNSASPERFPIWEVKTGVVYALALTTPYGFFSYMLGDTLEFISTAPYRIKVVGRTKHFINTVGEHLSAHHVEAAITLVNQTLPIPIKEFTIAPSPIKAREIYHEWFVDCDPSITLNWLAQEIDSALQKCSPNYKILRNDHSIELPIVSRVTPKAFEGIYAQRENLDTQHKIPRLLNERSLAEQLSYSIEAQSRQPQPDALQA